MNRTLANSKPVAQRTQACLGSTVVIANLDSVAVPYHNGPFWFELSEHKVTFRELKHIYTFIT